MSKLMGKKTIHLTGVTFENRQYKICNLKKNLKGAWLSLERRATPNDKNRIYVVAHTKDQKPFRIGTIPGYISFWLAPKLDQAQITSLKNNTKPSDEYLARIEHFQIIGGGDNRYYGIKADLIYEIKQTA